jgi:hypothetical protein
MTIVIGPPVLQSVGSASDGDPATPPCSHGPANGPGQCIDGPATSSGNPASATALSCVAQAAAGPNPVAPPITANGKAFADAPLTITYRWWERILAIFGVKQGLTASVSFTCFADVNDGTNQATFAVFITGGPGGAAPLPVYQRAYAFKRRVANPALIDVTKDGAAAGAIANPGVFVDADPGRTVPIDPGTYNLKFEINAHAIADGRVVLGPGVVLSLTEA